MGGLGAECNLFPKGGFVSGTLVQNCARVDTVVGSAEPRGVSTPLVPTNQVNPTNMRGVAKLGLENPELSDETRAYWFKALFGFKVRKIDEYDNEVHKT